MFLAANSTIWPMPSLLIVLTIVTTRVTLMPTLARFSIARTFTSNKLPTPRCLFFSDAVELQIDAVLASGLRGFAKLDVFSEANSIRRGQDAIEADLLCVSD